VNTFQELKLLPALQNALSAIEFNTPTPVQSKVLPVALQQKDVVAVAQTGSGKTAAYVIPILEKLFSDSERKSKALVVVPTRELAQQVYDFIVLLLKQIPGPTPRVVSIVGGASMGKQLHQLKANPRIIVATPGRLIDHLSHRSVRLSEVKTLVLDEGDRMLDMGFAPQLDQILRHVPQDRQTLLFTATLPKTVQSMTAKYLRKPERFQVGEIDRPVKTIRQSSVEVQQKKKRDLILDQLNARKGSVIVFLRTKHRTNQLAEYLQEYGYQVGAIHGGKSQGQRNRAMSDFRAGRLRILCATDLAARGLDIPHVEHVINFDLPEQREDYIHRIGRTGRNGSSGEAITFVTPEDRREWQALTKMYRIVEPANKTATKSAT
jgi:superfamily II DNA/RNA helicase